MEKLALQCFNDKSLSEQSLLHTERRTVNNGNTAVVGSGALCPADCSNPAAGVNSMETETSANKTLGGKYHTAHLAEVLHVRASV